MPRDDELLTSNPDAVGAIERGDVPSDDQVAELKAILDHNIVIDSESFTEDLFAGEIDPLVEFGIPLAAVDGTTLDVTRKRSDLYFLETEDCLEQNKVPRYCWNGEDRFENCTTFDLINVLKCSAGIPLMVSNIG